MYYQFFGGTYCCSSNTLAMWLGVTSNTGCFMQITVAWGAVNSNNPALKAPIFSVGWCGSLSQPPVTTVKQGHSYAMQVSYDFLGYQEWQFIIFDETANTGILNKYVSSITGTYIKPNTVGLVLEGVCGTQSCLPTGADIPNSLQSFTNPTYYLDCYSGCQYSFSSWVGYSTTNSGNYVVPPSNVAFKAYSSPVSNTSWCYNSCP